LGDAGSATGALDIDAASTLLATPASAQIRPFSDGQRVLVTNAGAIDLTGGASGPGGSMTIVGDYVGSGGRLLLRSVLASDGAPSDRLVLSGGFASGGTSIEVTNVGGAGALTSADGIMLVEAVNGA